MIQRNTQNTPEEADQDSFLRLAVISLQQRHLLRVKKGKELISLVSLSQMILCLATSNVQFLEIVIRTGPQVPSLLGAGEPQGLSVTDIRNQEGSRKNPLAFFVVA